MERGRGRTFSLVSAPEVLEDRGRQRRKQENPALCPLLGVGLGWAVAPGNVSVPGSPDPVHCTTVLEAGQGTGARETPRPASRTWPGPRAWHQEGTRRGHGPARDAAVAGGTGLLQLGGHQAQTRRPAVSWAEASPESTRRSGL